MANERAFDICYFCFTTFRPGAVHGPDSGILFANDAAERFLGLTMDQLLGKSN